MTSFSMPNPFNSSALMSEADLINALNRPSTARLALKELGQRRSPQGFEASRTFVIDQSLPLELRTTSAIELGKQATLENQKALIQALDSHEPMLIKNVAIALGQIGDAAALARLEAIQIPANHPATISLKFAKSLLSYRLQLNSHLIDVPREILPLERSSAVDLVHEPLPPSLLDLAQEDLQQQLPAIEISKQGGIQFTCHTSRYWILFTKVIYDTPRLADLQTKGTIAAVVLKESTCSATQYAVYEYIFVNPSKTNSLPVVGTRAAGMAIHAGELQIGQGQNLLYLNAANTVYSPALQLRGRLNGTEKHLILEDFRVSTTPLATQQRGRMPQPA